LVLLLGCDFGDRIDGVERNTATLEEALVAANSEVGELREALETERTRADTAAADRKALGERIDALTSQIASMEVKLEEQAAAPVVAPPTRAGRPDPAERYRVPVGSSASRGRDDAKVTVVMFSDFQCPFCNRARLTLTDVERRFGDDVRIVFKHNPLPMHNRARASAEAFEAARKQGKEWALHDLMFENRTALDDDDIERWAKKAGCGLTAFRADLRRSEVKRQVDDDAALAKRVGARGTPAFFINGRFLSGAQPLAAFAKLIEKEIEEADRRIAAGTPKSGVYDDLMRGAKTSP
jgi:protein-disulfide isomerase